MSSPEPYTEAAFMAEWEAAAALSQDAAQDILVGLGCSEELKRYVSQLRIYPRIPYLCASWIECPLERKEVGVALAIHAMGLKLFDDLVDGDTGLRAGDLATGQVLCQAAIERYHKCSNGKLLANNTLGEWLPVYRHVIAEHETTFRDLDHWLSGCRTKSLLCLYIESLYRTSLPDICDELREAFTLLVILGQVVDDWNDRDSEYETSNLFVMIGDGRIDRSSSIDCVETITKDLKSILAKHPPKLDFSPYVDALADRAKRFVNNV